jgi:hypothetical protein
MRSIRTPTSAGPLPRRKRTTARASRSRACAMHTYCGPTAVHPPRSAATTAMLKVIAGRGCGARAPRRAYGKVMAFIIPRRNGPAVDPYQRREMHLMGGCRYARETQSKGVIHC